MSTNRAANDKIFSEKLIVKKFYACPHSTTFPHWLKNLLVMGNVKSRSRSRSCK